jgi:hypothetical protein
MTRSPRLHSNVRWCAPTLALFAAACASDGEPYAGPYDDDVGGARTALASPDGKQLAAGRAHSCSLDPAISGVLCWGDNLLRQTAVPRLSRPTFIAAGGDVTCAIASDRVRCWGDGAHGQLAVPSRLGRATQVAVGSRHVCALTAAGAVRCWGDNEHGQLMVPALREVRAIAAGARHSCALTASGVVCWGDNALGQLDVPELDSPTALAVGGSHSCAIDGGAVSCWGGESAALLERVPDVTDATAIAAGASHSCVVAAGAVQCWGDAAIDLTPRELTLPQQVVVGGGDGVAHACARHLQGVTCWGDDQLGQTRYDGEPLHVLHRSVSDIAAPAALVWDILMDLDSYPRWNPYTIAMRSTLEVGDPMVMTVKMNALLTLEQTEHIRVLEPGHKVCWGIDTTTPEVNSGERCQWLEALPDGGTRYISEDLIEGTLNPLVSALFGNDVQVGFDGVARALKARAEAMHERP